MNTILNSVVYVRIAWIGRQERFCEDIRWSFEISIYLNFIKVFLWNMILNDKGINVIH